VIVRIITYERSTLVNDEKYIGLDVHQATISVAVMDANGKVVMESILETKAATILEFFAGLRGTIVAAIFLGHLYGVPLGPTQLLVIAFTGILASFSVPGVPHGWLLVISPLMVTMGIPAEGIGLLIAVDAIPDIFMTTLNVTGDMGAATCTSLSSQAQAVPLHE